MFAFYLKKEIIHKDKIMSETTFETVTEATVANTTNGREIINGTKTANQTSSPQIDAITLSQLWDELYSQQSLIGALIGGTIAALIAALIWAGITHYNDRFSDWLAVGVGFVLGLLCKFLVVASRLSLAYWTRCWLWVVV